MTMRWGVLALSVCLAAACRQGDDKVVLDGSTSTSSTTSVTSPTSIGEVTATDLGVSSGYVDEWFSGGWKRGRAAVVGDYDGDGRWDVFVGNPGDESFVLFNRSDEDGVRFEPGELLGDTDVMWGGVAGDVDNDGDTDLYVTIGGNERGGEGLDRMFLNHGDGTFVDRSVAANVWPRNKDGLAVVSYHAGAFTWDMNLDGWLDIFANHHVTPGSLVGSLERDEVLGINGILENDAVGSFQDRSIDLFMRSQWSTRSSTAFDFDNDGDFDLYENNWIGPNVFWRNDLVETGELGFTNITDEVSLGGGDMGFPGDRNSQAAIPFDFNQDGWEDLFIFRYNEELEPGEPTVHSVGHNLWINQEGEGFVEVAVHTGVNVGFTRSRRSHGFPIGVMGCQLGDLDADGIADLFMGYGSPDDPERNELMVSTGLTTVGIDGVGDVVVPTFESWLPLIDFASPADLERHNDGHFHYPYRTHGSTFADYDGDGLYELGAHNGGPARRDDEEAQEPNRLFHFTLPDDPAWLRLDLRGDGDRVARDAIGARARARVRDPDGSERWVYASQRSSTGFGAQNDGDLFLGLGAAVELLELHVRWPGAAETEIEPEGLRRRQTVWFEDVN